MTVFEDWEITAVPVFKSKRPGTKLKDAVCACVQFLESQLIFDRVLFEFNNVFVMVTNMDDEKSITKKYFAVLNGFVEEGFR